MFFKKLLVLSFFFLFAQKFAHCQQQGESPEIVTKWRQFVQSLTPTQRSEFDGLHKDAGRLSPSELAQRVESFKSSLSSEQKRTYEQIQQREGGISGGKSPSSQGGFTGGGGERQKTVHGVEGEPPARGSGNGGISTQGFDRWINNPELSENTRQSLQRIKEIFTRAGIDPVEKCKKIQHILQGIGSGDKKRMQMPAALLNVDCAQEDRQGAENLLAMALTQPRGK